jgi:hypothetical protein
VRRRGESLYSVTFALALAALLAGTLSQRVASQARHLRFAREEARAREALLDATERLRAGLVEPPAPGSVVRLGEEPYPVELSRATADAQLASPGLFPVRLRVRWRSEGRTRERELVTIVRGSVAR